MAARKKVEGRLKVGDRVIYWGLEKPHYGTVRWLGHIKNISDGLTAGVELDKRYGRNNGTWDNRTYFKCKEKCGLLIDANGLMLSADFGEEVAESDPESNDESDGENDESDENENDDDNASSDDDDDDNEAPIENGDIDDGKADVNELIRMLQFAIQEGLRQQSQEMAAKLAELRVKCEINLIQGGAKNKKKQQPPPVIPKPKKELRLNVKVERKDGLEEAFSVTVPDNFTLDQLKKQVENNFGYLAELQQWFFNDDLKKNGSLLINTFKCSEPILYIKEDPVNPDNGPFEKVERKSKGKNRTNKNGAKKTGPPKKEIKKQKLYKTPRTSREMKVKTKVVVEDVGWKCKACTYLNDPPRPGCVICGCSRPDDYVVPPELQRQFDTQQKELELAFEAKYIRELEENFSKYVELDDVQVVITNENFECKICYTDVEPGQGIRLRDCLHTFCRECLKGTVQNSEDIPVRCPFQDDDYACESEVQQREIQQLLSPEDFQKYLDRECAKAAGQSQNAFHCRTPDCKGWCIYDNDVTEFRCDVCGKTSCISCQAIHKGEDCKQYQERLKLEMAHNVNAKQTQQAIEEMKKRGEAMDCPGCGVMVMKVTGCDFMTCSYCRIAICWATKGPRWGPRGVGDTSGGCRCHVNGQPCHPRCLNCH